MHAYFFLSIRVARRFGEQMLSFLAHTPERWFPSYADLLWSLAGSPVHYDSFKLLY